MVFADDTRAENDHRADIRKLWMESIRPRVTRLITVDSPLAQSIPEFRNTSCEDARIGIVFVRPKRACSRSNRRGAILADVMVQAGQPPRMAFPRIRLRDRLRAFGIKDGASTCCCSSSTIRSWVAGVERRLRHHGRADGRCLCRSCHWRDIGSLALAARPTSSVHVCVRRSGGDSLLPFVESAGMVRGAVFYYLLFVTIALRISIACYEIPSIAWLRNRPDYDERTTILSIRLFCQAIIPPPSGSSPSCLPANTPAHPNGMLNRDGFFRTPFCELSMAASILISSWGTRSRIPY
jgi:hypothetical protein